jgi:hypothetical protein
MDNTNIISSSLTNDFNFDLIQLADPEPLHNNSGFYFTRLSLGENNEPLLFQFPECCTKQGIVSIKHSKYLDLMINRSNNNEIMRFIEQLEYKCQSIIDSKKELWFQTELTRDDIETMMSQVIRLYKSGEYMLIRVFLEHNKFDKNNCIAYDENEFGFDLDKLEPSQQIIPLVMIEGVKFSSRSFEISLKLTQVMVIGSITQKTSCLIKRNSLYNKNKEIKVDEVKVDEVNKVIENKEDIHLGQLSIQQDDLIEENTLTNNTDENKVDNVIPEKTVKNMDDDTNIIINTDKDTNTDILEEVVLEIDDSNDDIINLKKPNEVYYNIYKQARENAKEYRTKAIESYLEAKRIKTKYMLFDIEDSDDSDSDENYLG